MQNSNSAQGRVRERGKDDGGCCSIVLLKYFLFIFNFFFWLSGVGLIVVGTWSILTSDTYISLLDTGLYPASAYLLIVVGVLVVLIGFLGCCGAWHENRTCLIVYAVLLLIIFILEAVAGILAYIYEAMIYDELVKSLNYTIANEYGHSSLEKTKAVNDMQKHFRCCGAKNFLDWNYTQWRASGKDKQLVPASCCITITPDCGVRNHPSNIHYTGCVAQLESYFKDDLIIIGAVGLGICCLQIFGIVFACCLAQQLKEWEEKQRARAWM